MAFVTALRATEALQRLLAETANFTFEDDDYERPEDLEEGVEAERLKKEPSERFEPLINQIGRDLTTEGEAGRAW
ncbi:hypothetical protein PG995_004623 [Apiospora arundinis]